MVSNGAVVRDRRSAAGTKTVHFAETPKLSTYLVALVVGELEASRAVRVGSTPIRVWCVPGKKKLAGFALEVAAEALRRLEAYFGLPYPYGKLDLLAVPDFEFGAMENAGAVTFRETLLLVDPKTVTLAEKKRVAEVIAHELAHMWYGDLVTMAWWDDLWLNEAFATWMAFKIVDEWKPEWKMWLDFESHRAPAFALDALESTHPIYGPVASAERGDRELRRDHLREGRVGRAHARELARRRRCSAAACGATSAATARATRARRICGARSSRRPSDPVEPIVSPWVERPGFPLVAAQRVDRGGQAFLLVEQERFFASPKVGGATRARRPGRSRSCCACGRRAGAIASCARWSSRSARRIPLGASATCAGCTRTPDEASFVRALHDGAILRALGDELGAARARGAHGPARPPVGGRARRPRAARGLARPGDTAR